MGPPDDSYLTLNESATHDADGGEFELASNFEPGASSSSSKRGLAVSIRDFVRKVEALLMKPSIPTPDCDENFNPTGHGLTTPTHLETLFLDDDESLSANASKEEMLHFLSSQGADEVDRMDDENLVYSN